MYRQILIAIFIILSGTTFAQVNSDSPYSARGIGNVNFFGNAYVNALGGAATALTDSSEVNLFNPSTYSLLADQLPLFSIGLDHFEKSFTANGQSSSGRFTGLTHLALVIPFANRFGLAFGLKPFSRVGYEIHDYEMVGADSIHYVYSGEGGVQEIVVGFSGNIIDRWDMSLSAGINGMYYFGRIYNKRRSFINSSSGKKGGLDIKSLHAKDFSFKVGLNYEYKINIEHRFRIGATYRPGLDMKFDRSNTRIYFANYLETASYDTLINTGEMEGLTYIPAETKIGLTYIYAPHNDSLHHRRKLPSFLFTFEYGNTNWSQYQEEFKGSTETGQYVNASSYRFGFQYTPHRYPTTVSNFIGLFDKINYRVGAYYVNTPYSQKGLQLQDKGVTLGFGIPFLIHRNVSMVNISASYGVTGNPNISHGVQENYFGFNIGINIAPAYDRWFKKYKLN